MSGESPRYDELPDGAGLRVAVLVGRFNASVTEGLRDGAVEGLRTCGVADEDVLVEHVPGAFELPLAARQVAGSGEVDAVVCLGAVIRGGTPHFEYVSGEAAAGIMRAGLDTGVPVVFGVLTTDDDDQAVERSGPGADNKGYEAALGAVEMAVLLRRLPGGTGGAPGPGGGPAGGDEKAV